MTIGLSFSLCSCVSIENGDEYKKNDDNKLELTFSSIFSINIISISYMVFSSSGKPLSSLLSFNKHYNDKNIYSFTYIGDSYKEEIGYIYYEIDNFMCYSKNKNYKEEIKKKNNAYHLYYLDEKGYIQYDDIFHVNDDISSLSTRTLDNELRPYASFLGYSLATDYNDALYDFSSISLNRNYLFKPVLEIDEELYKGAYRNCSSDMKCTLKIVTTRYKYKNILGLEFTYDESSISGTAIVYKEVGSTKYALTCYHCIEDDGLLNNQKIKYQVSNITDSFKAEVVARDSLRDLAVIKFTNRGNSYDPRPIRYDFSYLTSDRNVLAIGNPHNQTNVITTGKILGTSYHKVDREYYETSDKEMNYDSFEHSAYITNGNSGGPLFDIDFNIIGINSSTNRYSQAVAGNEIYTFLSMSNLLP